MASNSMEIGIAWYGRGRRLAAHGEAPQVAYTEVQPENIKPQAEAALVTNSAEVEARPTDPKSACAAGAVASTETVAVDFASSEGADQPVVAVGTQR